MRLIRNSLGLEPLCWNIDIQWRVHTNLTTMVCINNVIVNQNCLALGFSKLIVFISIIAHVLCLNITKVSNAWESNSKNVVENNAQSHSWKWHNLYSRRLLQSQSQVRYLVVKWNELVIHYYSFSLLSLYKLTLMRGLIGCSKENVKLSWSQGL